MREISFNVISGAKHPQTIHILGKLRNKNATALIDGDSPHNFIDQAIVTKFGLPIVQNKKFHVTTTNHDQIECMGLCKPLTIYIQGKSITADYYVLPVTACQLVLRVQWLETIGPIEMDK